MAVRDSGEPPAALALLDSLGAEPRTRYSRSSRATTPKVTLAIGRSSAGGPIARVSLWSAPSVDAGLRRGPERRARRRHWPWSTDPLVMNATSSVRLVVPVLASKFPTWVSTVRVDTYRRSAISALVRRSAMSRTTSISLLVTPNPRSHVGTAAAPRPRRTRTPARRRWSRHVRARRWSLAASNTARSPRNVATGSPHPSLTAAGHTTRCSTRRHQSAGARRRSPSSKHCSASRWRPARPAATASA